MSLLGQVVSGFAGSQSIISGAKRLLSNPVINSIFNKFASDGLRQAVGDVISGGTSMSDPVKDLKERSDPHLSWHYSILLPFGLPPMYIEDVDIPLLKIESNPYHRANSKRYDPGFVDVDPVSIVFYEDIRGTVLAFLNNWRQLVVDPNGYYGRPSDYKRNIIISLHDPKGNPLVIFQCEGCWPSSINNISLQSDSNERTRITAEFSCDNVQYQVIGAGAGFVQDMNINFGGGKWWAPLANTAIREVTSRIGLNLF